MQHHALHGSCHPDHYAVLDSQCGCYQTTASEPARYTPYAAASVARAATRSEPGVLLPVRFMAPSAVHAPTHVPAPASATGASTSRALRPYHSRNVTHVHTNHRPHYLSA